MEYPDYKSEDKLSLNIVITNIYFPMFTFIQHYVRAPISIYHVLIDIGLIGSTGQLSQFTSPKKFFVFIAYFQLRNAIKYQPVCLFVPPSVPLVSLRLSVSISF